MVATGTADDSHIAVVSGLKETEQVIVGPSKTLLFLIDGEKVPRGWKKKIGGRFEAPLPRRDRAARHQQALPDGQRGSRRAGRVDLTSSRAANTSHSSGLRAPASRP